MTVHFATPAMGLIVLRVDETIEQEFRGFVPPELARLHVTRIPSGDDLTPESIAQMELGLTTAASLLPEAADFDVVGYACTSATAMLGAETVAQRIEAGVPTRSVTDPLTAAIWQLEQFGAQRIGIVSPYIASVAERLVHAFEDRGVEVASTLSLDEQTEAKVARIPLETTAKAARRLAAERPVDAMFLSCTNLNTAALLAPLSEELGRPVLSSNQVLAAHMRALSGLA